MVCLLCSDSQIIVNVSPSDFDGDGCLDVLIATGSENASSRVTVYVYWGNLQSLLGICAVLVIR